MKKSTLGITPMPGKIIVRPDSASDSLQSGIVLPATRDKSRKSTGVIEAVDEYNDLSLKVGQRVLYEEYGPHQITHDSEEFVIIDTADTAILAVINSEAEVNVHEQ